MQSLREVLETMWDLRFSPQREWFSACGNSCNPGTSWKNQFLDYLQELFAISAAALKAFGLLP
jgi:hypothetical protein